MCVIIHIPLFLFDLPWIHHGASYHSEKTSKTWPERQRQRKRTIVWHVSISFDNLVVYRDHLVRYKEVEEIFLKWTCWLLFWRESFLSLFIYSLICVTLVFWPRCQVLSSKEKSMDKLSAFIRRNQSSLCFAHRQIIKTISFFVFLLQCL